MLVQEGGQERVLRALQEVFPKAPTFVLIYDKQKKQQFYTDKDIRSTFLQKMPGVEKKYQWYLPMMSTAIESHDLREFDVIVSSSSSFAKGVVLKPNTVHICYCHTPTRYLWSDASGYVEDLAYPNVIKKILPFYLSYLRNWDWSAAQRVDHFLCNSKTVQERIKRYYTRGSQVIYPPVDVDKFYISNKLGDYYLIGGRLVPYKRYDLAINAFNKLNLPLKVFGTGVEFEKLKALAKPNIDFLGNISEQRKAELFSKCIAFIHPQEEDFGITCVEAMAAGRPVIAYGRGGANETIMHNVTGEFLEDQSWENLANTIIHFKPENYDAETIKSSVERFNKQRFKQEIREFVGGIVNSNW